MRDQPKPEPQAPPEGSNCDKLTDAALDAEAELSRLEDIVTETVMPEGDPEEGLDELIAEIDTNTASGKLRDALGMDETGTRRAASNERRFKKKAD